MDRNNQHFNGYSTSNSFNTIHSTILTDFVMTASDLSLYSTIIDLAKPLALSASVAGVILAALFALRQRILKSVKVIFPHETNLSCPLLNKYHFSV